MRLRLLLLVPCALALTACGVKGPLTLPPKQTSAQAAFAEEAPLAFSPTSAATALFAPLEPSHDHDAV
ncbi:LPS translocon maturation chaperone LptM [Hydrogenophilus thermoluteolus]|uniref:LPS translocon maturation chaperone LptM n=1 Tax=Hydrogenophilus thermoluteolus TaxID=297 RepID=UPI000E65BBEF